MRMHTSIDVQKFREYEGRGLITARPHPSENLIIWNYTQKAQYDNVWDDVTKQARGLITTSDGRIVARPFQKFMNIEQHQGPLPLEPFKVTEKMDGSLGILYFVQDKPYIATRGSFTSEQALRANVILEQYRYLPLLTHYTYLFEIVYPENQIVVDYGTTEALILLAVIHTETCHEIDIHEPSFAFMWETPIVRHYDGVTDIATLRDLQEANKEGFVIRFEGGLRLKVKFSEYVRLHRLITRVNARVIWDLLRTNQPIDDLLERVPDEFYAWVKRTCADFNDQYQTIELQSLTVLEQVKDLPTRKEQAMIIVKSKYSGVIFAMLDNKRPQDAIWKLLYPDSTRPFKIDDQA